MVPYQVVIEGVFLQLGDEANQRLGFHTTFYVVANNASNAVHRARDLLATRMRTHDVRETSLSGFFRTHYLVHDLWEITEQKFKEKNGFDSGFTFFRIRPLEKLQLALRYAFFKRAKPWRLVQQTGE